MGLNRESKRRKIRRRKSCDIEIISEIIQPMNMPLRSWPVRGGDVKEAKRTINDETDPSVSGESSKSLRMRRHSKSIENAVKGKLIDTVLKNELNPVCLAEAVINSPIKTKSINMYFGALNRIENGERFTILAKRLTFDGKEQYLLDWETAPNSNGTPCTSMKKEH